jgi:hypothetical protein
VGLVSPRLSVEPFTSLDVHFRKPPKHPKKVEHLFTASLTSGEIVDLDVLRLGDLDDKAFLVSLALALDAGVAKGLDIARRLGWCGEGAVWRLGPLRRVYYVSTSDGGDGEKEPDAYHTGIAPSVKLLHTTVSRLIDIDISAGMEFVRRWKVTNSAIHRRLWAAVSRDSRVASGDEVGSMLLSLEDRSFWLLGVFPEIAELRAKRFGDLGLDEQQAIIARIRRLPPRGHWPRKAEGRQVARARLYWALRELRRIEIAGGSLPRRDKAWLDARIQDFPDLAQMTRLDEGFAKAVEAHEIPSNPDDRFDVLTGEERLKALEASLSKTWSGWDEDPASRAADWIRQAGSPGQILADLESIPDGGAAFARVWERFAWVHSPGVGQTEEATSRDLSAEAGRVLSLLIQLPEESVRRAIDGISHWLFVWQRHVVALPEGIDVWIKLWPIAVEATNARKDPEEDVPSYMMSQSSPDQEAKPFDTLNTPAGKLVGVFLTARPNLSRDPHPFSGDGAARTMRDMVIAADGRSGLIALYRMIEELPHFLTADRDWAQAYLIKSLSEDNEKSRTLWRAVARRTRFRNVLMIIGCQMAERITDRGLSRETRRSLVFSLVIECLHAFRERREPAVPYARITQIIRLLDDEVRRSAADAVQRFVHDVSRDRGGERTAPSPEQLFQLAAAPFLQQVWPQERSLATPGVSAALADLPATSRGAFADCVGAIERFLVPFECWTLVDYGLRGEEGGRPRLSIIDDQEKADALLRLLDLTVGAGEGAVIPHDLADALDQIRETAPKLAETQAFRRLATAARRR